MKHIIFFLALLKAFLLSPSILAQNVHVTDLPSLTNESVLYLEDESLLLINSINGVVLRHPKGAVVTGDKNYGIKDVFLQGPILRAQTGEIFVTTYTNLYKFDPERVTFNPIEIVDDQDQPVHSEFRLINIVQDSILFFQIGKNIGRYNIAADSQLPLYHLGGTTFSITDVVGSVNDFKIITGDNNDAVIYHCKNRDVERIELKQGVTGVKAFEDCFYGVIDNTTLIKSDWDGNILLQIDLHATNATYISPISSDIFAISADNEILFYSHSQERIVRRELVKTPVQLDDITRIFRVSMSRDSMLWFGAAQQGVFGKFIGQKQFDFLGFPEEQFVVFDGQEFDDRIFWTSMSHGLVDFSKEENELRTLKHAKNTPNRYIERWSRDSFILSNNGNVAIYDANRKYAYSIKAIKEAGQLQKDNRGNLYYNAYLGRLLRLTKEKNKWISTSYAICPTAADSSYSHFFFDAENRLYISKGVISILVFDADHNTLLKEIPLRNGLTSLTDQGDHVLVTNYDGLYKIFKSNFTYEKILDKDNKLDQHLYGLLIDDNGYYWLSSNSGLYRYDTSSNYAHQFKLADGLQGLEYNTMSYLEDKKGRFYFGGINGLNVFDPLEVKLSDKQVPIHFYNYKINDVDSRDFGYANSLDHIDLYHDNNTITFEFVGVDYSGNEYVNLKYFMDGQDRDWVELDENNGVARYANLPYGRYTFNMLASNADEVWSKEPRQISVVVHAPFWATWWFRLFFATALLAFIYYQIRSYYRRRLERQNLLLRQQALIIEKQEAVEKERNRIAGEMHDDLGSGLTTIKYLSERAVKSTTSEKEAGKIKRIAEHANTLVSNMSEIIWAMNSRYDTASDLSGYIRHYASAYVEEHGKSLRFSSTDITYEITLSGEKRRAIFLVTKELLHNFIKYADVDEVSISMTTKNNELIIDLLEVGALGFDPAQMMGAGNGLFNMQKRMQYVGGSLLQQQTPDGMLSTITFPLN